MYVSLLFLLERSPKKSKIPSIKPLQHRIAQIMKRKNRPASTPITIPAIAPAERPLLLVVAVIPGTEDAEAEAPPAVGVTKGTVVVAEPVDVTVTAALLVGLTNALAVAVVVDSNVNALLLSLPALLLAAHCPV